MVKYSAQQQEQVALAMEASPQAPWVIFIQDYGKLRAQARAACEE